MPDSQVPPIWGPAYDERDLDALLSGETGGTPVALQPVEGTLAALRAAATRRELSDEAVARAAFRAFAFAPAPLTPPTQPWTAPAEHADVTAHTLVLPPAGRRQQPAARHRHRRRTGRSARKPSIAVTAAAAAALIVVATAVTGALTGSIGELTSFGRQPASASASARATGQSPGSEGVLVTGAARDRLPTPKTTVSVSPAPRPTPDPRSLCREYFGDFGHPGQDAGAAWIALNGQLSRLAGGPLKIPGYCLHALGYPLAGKGGWPPAGGPAGGDGAPGRADPASGSLGAASQGSQPSATGDRGQIADPGVSVDNP
jgi:hypothetical protein